MILPPAPGVGVVRSVGFIEHQIFYSLHVGTLAGFVYRRGFSLPANNYIKL